MAAVKNDNWVRRFEVTDPKKHKNGFTVYKVTSVKVGYLWNVTFVWECKLSGNIKFPLEITTTCKKVFYLELKVFPKSAPEASTSVIVWKRYNDFKKLYEKLKHYHKQFKINEELPHLRKGKYFKRFEENVIKDRINFALELLNFIGRHPSLFTSDLFLQFFNNGYNIAENSSAVNDGPDINENGNNNDLTSALTQDVKSNGLPDPLWDYSDEDSNITSDTPDSVSPIRSLHSLQEDEIRLPENLDSALDIVEDLALPLEERMVKLEETNLVTECETGETITCRSEKPVEVCLSVRTEDFRSVSDSISSDLTEEWITPPGTPIGRQEYLVEAAYHVGQAQKHEVDGEFEAAFCFYKAAIACLLSGVQDDDDKFRRQAVKEKISQYLQRAEKIYSLHLSPEKTLDPKPVLEPLDELKAYKVLKIVDSTMVVLNTLEGKRYVVKVLHKSPCPVDGKKKTIIPYNVPYMVKLVKYFENDGSIFLVLEYVQKGKLWDHLSKYTLTGRHLFEDDSKSLSYDSITKVSNQSLNVPTIRLSDEDLTKVEDQRKSKTVELDLDTMNLLENSQKLLNSVSKTLQDNEKLTSCLSKELVDIETVFDLKCKLFSSEKAGERVAGEKKRSRSAASRPKLERSHSTEDVSDSRPRTASNSVDRRSEWLKLDSSVPRLSESTVRAWGAELLVALENLHRWGIICKDLHPGNVLLGDQGQAVLTFQAHWKGVDSLVSEKSLSGLYAAPENMSVFPITPAADWWSFGALLHHLLTGKTLASCYPDGILGHTILTFPDYLSPEVCSLLKELLRYEPNERLGSGVNGTEDIKCHPFFSTVDWQNVYDNC